MDVEPLVKAHAGQATSRLYPFPAFGDARSPGGGLIETALRHGDAGGSQRHGLPRRLAFLFELRQPLLARALVYLLLS
jgi:hypothetical protein